MAKKKTSIVIDDQVWKDFKKFAIDEDRDLSELLEEVIKEKLKK